VSPISYFSGEFRERKREAEFREHRLPETLNQARLLFIASAILNTLFLASDWRFYGQPHFFVAIPARLAVIAVSLLCLWLIGKPRSFAAAQCVMLVWQVVTGIAVALLVSSHSDIALMVVLMLPMIYFLVVPSSFRWTLGAAGGCSLLLLAAYAFPNPPKATIAGLLLATLVLNVALSIAVGRANRLRRLEWAATQSAQAAHEDLARSRDTLETVFRTVPVPLIVTTLSGQIVDYNDASAEFFGCAEAATAVNNIMDINVSASDRKLILSKIQSQQSVDGFEAQLRRADGSIRDVLISSRMASLDGSARYVSSMVDITDRKLVELHLGQLAMSDPLTGLANRSHFITAASRAIAVAAEKGTEVAILLLDVDDFKQINDTAGHDAGDAVLRAVAVRLQASVRPGDVVARLGGDEFAIMLMGLQSEADLDAIIERVETKLNQPLIHASRSLACKASVGAACFPLHATQIEDLMKCADIALYEAKTRGRGRGCIFESSMLAAWELHAGMIAKARAALIGEQLVPYYQPQVDLRTGAIIGFEALLRVIQPNGEIVFPGAISAAFEYPDLAQAITAKMVAAVVKDLRGWIENGIEIGHVAINVSGADLRNENFPAELLASLDEANIPCNRIELEVTESVFLGRGAENVERALRTLSAAGIRIALDDFGTGYASLSHLKQFPIDVIKIDQCFVRDLEDDPDDAAIIRAVLNLGYSLGIQTVAEGIEGEAQADYLRAGGCHFGQGYLFSPAVAAAEVPQLFERAREWLPNKKAA